MALGTCAEQAGRQKMSVELSRYDYKLSSEVPADPEPYLQACLSVRHLGQ